METDECVELLETKDRVEEFGDKVDEIMNLDDSLKEYISPPIKNIL